MDPGVLHRLPERQLSRREFPTGRRFGVVVTGGRVLGDGVGLQVGQVSQLGLAEAMVAQALHDAADFGSRSQGAVRSAQRTGSRWRGLALLTRESFVLPVRVTYLMGTGLSV